MFCLKLKIFLIFGYFQNSILLKFNIKNYKFQNISLNNNK